MTDKNIKILVIEKKAILTGTPVIVCGNSDYTVTFTFDDEWNLTGPRTARFVYVKDGKVQHEDVLFPGNVVAVPILENVDFVDVGVFAGNLCTTTPARVHCKKSILCGSGVHNDPTPDVYDQIMELFNEMAEAGAFGATEAQAQQIEKNKQDIAQLDAAKAEQEDFEKILPMSYPRRFKPKVMLSMYIPMGDAEEHNKRLEYAKEIGCDGVVMLVNLKADDNFTLEDDLTELVRCLEYTKEIGLPCNTLKIHCLMTSEQQQSTAYLNSYIERIKGFLTDINADSYGITRLCLLNELGAMPSDMIASCLSEFKNMGYEVGVSNAGITKTLSSGKAQSVYDNSDYFGANYYQRITPKAELTSYNDSLHSWSGIFDGLKLLKKDSNKKVIFTETGILDYWEYLHNPADFDYHYDGTAHKTNGEIYPIYYYGLFNNSEANAIMDEVWLWYPERMVEYESVREFFKYYLGGVR